MSYFNVYFSFLFIPILIIVYNLMPKKARPFVLLLASFGFFFVVSKIRIIFIILSILSIYGCSRLMSKIDNKKKTLLENATVDEKKIIKNRYKKRKRLILISGILFNLSFLFFFKYLNFIMTNTNILLDVCGVDYNFKLVHFLAPIGISFYTLQALSYMIDVYNEKIEADKNVFRVALYLSFFPQIMEGPITKYSDTANSLYEGNKVTYNSFCFGYQRILYGYLKKIVISDRLNILVQTIFNGYTSYSGTAIFLGAVAYTIMLYMEFSGTMDIVIGIGEMFGVKITENFRQPFFSKNISEFWMRWHISLGTWFKDYIFYPVSLSKPMKKITMKARKVLGNHIGPLISGAVALFIVWFLNGLWHGAGWTFLLYGLYQFLLILLGNIFEPIIKKICAKIHVDRKNIVYRVFQSVKMTMFVFIGELIFRANTVSDAIGMIKKIFTNFTFKAFSNGEILSLGVDSKDFLIVFITLIAIFIISLLKEKNMNIREEISKKHIVVRWLIYYLLILALVVFGAYGPGYLPVDPIYADF